MERATLQKQLGRAAAMLSFALIATPAIAQHDENLDNNSSSPTPSETAETNRLPYTLSSGVSEQFNTGINAGGTLAITRVNAGVAIPFRLADSWTLGTSFKYGLDSYDFRGLPLQWQHGWTSINTYTFGSIVQWKIDDHWSTYLGGFVRESGEQDARFSEGITGGGLIGANYKFSDTLTVGLGIGGATQLEEHGAVLPIVTANWKFADHWRFRLGLTDAATAGYGAQLTYDISPRWQLGLGFQHQKSRFRINGGPFPILVFPSGKVYQASRDGIGQNDSSALFVQATWHATGRLDVETFAGAVLGGNLRLMTHYGSEIVSSDYNTAAIVGLKARLHF